MKPPAFWSAPGAMAGLALSPLGLLVSRVTLARMDRPRARAPVPLICVGNPTVGGAGKTPVTAAVAAHLRAIGRTPAVLMRGHGGALEGPLVVTPGHGPADVGDEALLHVAAGLTVVARDRTAGAALAAARGADVIVMDDGFQSPGPARTLTLLVVDGGAGLGNGHVLPAGPLRARFSPQMARADVLVVVGPGRPGEALAAAVRSMGKPVVTGALVPDPQVAAGLRGQSVLAFCGIGRPTKLAETLGALGVAEAALWSYDDHHSYTEADAVALMKEADRSGRLIVTTAKDAVKLRDGPARQALAARTIVLPVTFRTTDDAAFARLIEGAL